MASGLPDYLRSIRPEYGGARLETGSKTVTENVVTDLCDDFGKGVIYGGVIWLDYTKSQLNSVVQLMIDAKLINDLSFLRLNDYGITKAGKNVVSLNMYDHTNYVYSVGISPGVTFERYFKLRYDEQHGTTPTVHYRIIYSLLE